MRALLYFTRAYPSQSAVVLLCMLVGGLLGGIGYSTVLPMLSLATAGPETGAPSGFEAQVLAVLARVGIPRELGPLLAVVVAAFLLKAPVELLANSRVGYTVAHIATDLRLRLLRALLGARWGYYTRLPVGEVTNAMATEANRASNTFWYLTQGLTFMVEAGAAGAVALAVSWRATLFAVLAGILSSTLLHVFVRLTSRAGRKQTRVLQRLLGRMTGALQAIKLLKATGREELIGPLLRDDTERLQQALRRQVVGKEALRSLQEPIVVTLSCFGLFGAIQLLGMAAAEAFMLMVLFARTLNTVNKAQRKFQAASIDESALFAMLARIEAAERERESDAGSAIATLEHSVSLRNVCLDYDGRSVLQDVSLELPRGEATAILGVSGAGKTTLVDLIAGLTRPDSGEVCVDGTPLPELDLLAWRQSIGYVPQELLALHESVRNNVTLGDPDITEADVEEALRSAGAWEFVCELPDGLDASVGEGGALLSGGQRQRLAIARALVHRPRLLILDEATAALDADSEAAVWATVAALRGKTTVVAISHQPALVGVADHAYRLEGGSLTAIDEAPEAPLHAAADGDQRAG